MTFHVHKVSVLWLRSPSHAPSAKYSAARTPTTRCALPPECRNHSAPDGRLPASRMARVAPSRAPTRSVGANANPSPSSARLCFGTMTNRHGINDPWSGAAAAAQSNCSICIADGPGSINRFGATFWRDRISACVISQRFSSKEYPTALGYGLLAFAGFSGVVSTKSFHSFRGILTRRWMT